MMRALSVIATGSVSVPAFAFCRGVWRGIGPYEVRHARRRASSCLGLLAGLVLLFLPSVAFAAGKHSLVGTFGSVAQPSFVKPEALAVEQATGDLLVVDVEAKTISRWHADGTPADFTALGANVIDGTSGADETPQKGLSFGANPQEVQVAVDDSGGATAGDIYITQESSHLVDIFAPSGEYLGQLTASSEGAIGLPIGVAVDPTGAVYVSEFNLATARGEINKYVPGANPVVNADNTANFVRPGFGHLVAGASSTAGFIFSNQFIGHLSKLDSATGTEQYEFPKAGNTIVAVNPTTGHLYDAERAEEGEHGAVNEFDASGLTEASVLSSFTPPSEAAGVAVDEGSGNVYVARAGSGQIEMWGPTEAVLEAVTAAASPVGAESATLRGSVNPAGVPLTDCHFEYDTTVYKHGEAPHGTSVPCEAPNAAEVGSGSVPVAVHANVAGLNAGTVYHYRLVAGNAGATSDGEQEGFQTPGPGAVTGPVSHVTATSATISGQVDPNGQASTFHFEYGPTEAYGSSAPVVDGTVTVPVGAGSLQEGSHEVTEFTLSQGLMFAVGQEITGEGIPPGTTVIEVSGSRLILSKKATITEATITGGVALTSPSAVVSQTITGLAPDTVYHFRLVAHNATATSRSSDGRFSTFPTETGALPDGRAYELVSPPDKAGEVIPPEPSETSLGGSCGDCLPGMFLEIMPMQDSPDGESVLYEGQPFSEGLSSAADEYIAARGVGGWGTQAISGPLFKAGFGQGYQAFSPSLTQGVVYQAEPTLSPEAPTRAGQGFANLYLRGADGSLQPLITEEPPERDPGLGNGNKNAFRVLFQGANTGIGTSPAFGHVVFQADDALTVATATAPAAPEVGEDNKEEQGCSRPGRGCDLYEWVDGQLRLVNVLPGNATATAGAVLGSGRLQAHNPAFEGPDVDHAVSADGSRIFFSDETTGQVYVRIDGTQTSKIKDPGLFLTATPDGSKVLLNDGCLYSLAAEECEADLAQGHGEKFEGILGAAEDLTQVYFVDTAILTAGQENANHEHAEVGKFNLYTWHDGTTTFIGRLLESDNEFNYGDWKPSRSSRTAQVTGDGSYLAFMSSAPLTGHDSDRSGGGGCGGLPACTQVFEYASGTLTCVSCNPDGQRPLGPSNLSLIKGGLFLPPFRQPGNLSSKGGGRVFFESQDALSPRDTNGNVTDVYEWEPAGVGGCKRAGGCVNLISSGASSNDSMFLDSTPSGDDAFFITRDRLVNADQNDQLDLYDARAPHTTGELVGPSGETPPCGGEACAGPVPSAPASGPPGSSIFTGPGNFALTFTPPPGEQPKPLTQAQKLAKALKACAKKPRRQRETCRAQAIRHYGPISAKGKSRKAGS